MAMPAFQLLFALEQALSLCEPCFFSLGVMLSALTSALDD